MPGTNRIDELVAALNTSPFPEPSWSFEHRAKRHLSNNRRIVSSKRLCNLLLYLSVTISNYSKNRESRYETPILLIFTRWNSFK